MDTPASSDQSSSIKDVKQLGTFAALASLSYVFWVCAAIICLNFLLLLSYKEADKEERLAHRAKVKSGAGLVSAAGMVVYGRWTLQLKEH